MKRLTLLLFVSVALVVGQAAQDDKSTVDPAAKRTKRAKKSKKARTAKVKKVRAAARQAQAGEAAKPAEAAAQAAKAQEAAAAATPAADKRLEGFIEVGARAVSDVRGDWNTYRSVVNLNDGVRLTAADLKLEPGGKLADSILLQLHDIGDPYSTVRLDMKKTGVYRFTGSYSNIAYFNYLPSYADPTMTTTGVFMNQRAYDTQVQNSDNELLLNPGGIIEPYVAFSRNTDHGRGLSTLVDGNDQFPMVNNINWRQDDFRIGARVNWQSLHGSFEQGSLSFKDDQGLNSNGAGVGDRTTPYLGQWLNLADGWQAYYIRGSGSYTKAYVAYSPTPWFDLYGHIYRSDPSLRSSFNQLAQGTLSTNDPNLAFNVYSLGFDQLYGNAMMPRRTYSVAFELRPVKRLRVRQSVESDEFHDDSSATITSLYQLASGTSATTGATLPGLLQVSQYKSTTEALYDVNKSVMVRGGYRYEWGDALNVSGLTSTTLPYESGELKRHVGLAGARVRPAKWITLNADLEASNGVKTFYRTGLADYTKLNVEARATLLPTLFFNAGFHYLNNTNPADGVDAKFRSNVENASLQWVPAKKNMTIIAEYTHSQIKSDVDYFTIFPLSNNNQSLYRDYAHTGTVLAEFTFPGHGVMKPKLAFGGSFVTTSGTRPSRYYQPETRLSLPVTNHVQLFSEWKYYSLSQAYYSYEGFHTNMVLSGLRFTM